METERKTKLHTLHPSSLSLLLVKKTRVFSCHVQCVTYSLTRNIQNIFKKTELYYNFLYT